MKILTTIILLSTILFSNELNIETTSNGTNKIYVLEPIIVTASSEDNSETIETIQSTKELEESLKKDQEKLFSIIDGVK